MVVESPPGNPSSPSEAPAGRGLFAEIVDENPQVQTWGIFAKKGQSARVTMAFDMRNYTRAEVYAHVHSTLKSCNTLDDVKVAFRSPPRKRGS